MARLRTRCNAGGAFINDSGTSKPTLAVSYAPTPAPAQTSAPAQAPNPASASTPGAKKDTRTRTCKKPLSWS